MSRAHIKGRRRRRATCARRGKEGGWQSRPPGQTAVPFIAINVIKRYSARPHERGSGGGAITPLRTLVSLVQSPQRFNLEPQSRNFNHATSKEVCAPLQPHLIHCIPAVPSYNCRKIRSTYVSRKCGGYKFCAFTMFLFSHEQKKTEAASQKLRRSLAWKAAFEESAVREGGLSLQKHGSKCARAIIHMILYFSE